MPEPDPVTLADLARRVARTEARQAIAELPTRYAIAVDARDVDAWLALFVEDVDCGRRGKGREVLRQFIEPNLKTFYRSIHQVCGQVVDFIDDDTATGTVYCRAEHEDGDRWIVMAIVYFDRYVRRDGGWYFERRQEKHFYAAEIDDRPRAPFQDWHEGEAHRPRLPGDFAAWGKFWQDADTADIAALTRLPA